MYVEFINQDRFVPSGIFFALGGQSAWRDPKDELLGQISRLGGTGPLPGRMAFCRFDCFKRLDEWEDHFRSEHHRADQWMNAKHKAIEHWRAGCYDESVVACRRLDSPRYYVAFFEDLKTLDDDSLQDLMVGRTHRTGATFEFALRPIGGLGAERKGLIVWSLAPASLARSLSEQGLELNFAAAGLYRNF